MKNYEVKLVYKAVDDNGKEIKKTELILVIGAISCADAEMVVMSNKAQLGNCDATIVSSKETKLIYHKLDREAAIDDSFYKVSLLYAIGSTGDKLKFERENYLIESDRLKTAVTKIEDTYPYEEIISASKSRIVEVLEVNE